MHSDRYQTLQDRNRESCDCHLLSWGRRKILPRARDNDQGLGVHQEKVQNNALTLLAKAKEPEKGREGTVWSFSFCYSVLLKLNVAPLLYITLPSSASPAVHACFDCTLEGCLS